VESRCGAVPWFKTAQDQEVLDRGAVDSWNPPQRGLGVTGKSSTPRDKFGCQAWLSLLLAFLLFYFEQFTLLELDLYLVTLGCKPF
jgi:hypothetical protein